MGRDRLRAFGAIRAKLLGKTRLTEFAALAIGICDHFFHVEEVNVAAVALEALGVVASVIERALVGRDLALANSTVVCRTIGRIELFLVKRRLIERVIVLVGFGRDSLKRSIGILFPTTHEAVLVYHALIGELALSRVVQRIHAALSGQRGR